MTCDSYICANEVCLAQTFEDPDIFTTDFIENPELCNPERDVDRYNAHDVAEIDAAHCHFELPTHRISMAEAIQNFGSMEADAVLSVPSTSTSPSGDSDTASHSTSPTGDSDSSSDNASGDEVLVDVKYSLTHQSNHCIGQKRKQGMHGHQDPKKARTAQMQKWSGNSDSAGGQEDIIKVKMDKTLAPHGVASFVVTNLPQFQKRRSRWFHRNDIKNEHDSDSDDLLPQAMGKPDKENSVNQAFRRNGLIPERKAGTRGYDWENGKTWTFDPDTYSKYGASSKVRQQACWSGAAAVAMERVLDTFVCYLSKEVMWEPVVVPESGYSYERAFIEPYLEAHMRDPRTNMALTSTILVHNHTLREVIQNMRAGGFLPLPPVEPRP